jgi:hypothetical protein
MPMIWQNVHAVPAQEGSSVVYINNYIDFELYNQLYSPTFRTDSDRTIRVFKLYWRRKTKED